MEVTSNSCSRSVRRAVDRGDAPRPTSRKFLGHVSEFVLGLPAVQAVFPLKRLEDAVLHPADGMLLVLVLPFEDVALREVLDRPDEKPLVSRFGVSMVVGHR